MRPHEVQLPDRHWPLLTLLTSWLPDPCNTLACCFLSYAVIYTHGSNSPTKLITVSTLRMDVLLVCRNRECAARLPSLHFSVAGELGLGDYVFTLGKQEIYTIFHKQFIARKSLRQYIYNLVPLIQQLMITRFFTKQRSKRSRKININKRCRNNRVTEERGASFNTLKQLCHFSPAHIQSLITHNHVSTNHFRHFDPSFLRICG